MLSPSFDDPSVLAAMRAFVAAADALDAATADADILNRSEAKAVAGLSLRKRLIELGWQAPAGQRSKT